jgi:hypothetical protein
MRTLAPRQVDPLGALLAGPVARAGGVAVFQGLPAPETCAGLAAEAWRAYPESDRQDLDAGDDEEGRGGTPARALQTAAGGPVQDELYASPGLHAILSEQCGVPIVPSGNRGSYSYYVQPGDFLDTHLDIDTCDVTLITVVYDDIDANDAAGALAVYPGAFGASLSTIRAAPGRGVAYVKARPGESIVILGGLVPHRVVPLGARGQRVISALCFEAVAA